MTHLSSIRPLLSSFKQTVESIYGKRLVKVLLYGSYARGEQHEESDIDVMVVLEDEGFDKIKDDLPLKELFYHYFFHKDTFLMPIVIPWNRYQFDTSPFFYFVRKEQIEIE